VAVKVDTGLLARSTKLSLALLLDLDEHGGAGERAAGED
jgi:hypothetical protein